MLTKAMHRLRDVMPKELIRSYILHIILLQNLLHLLDWVNGFLQSDKVVNAWHSIRSSMLAYHANYVPLVSHRVLSQVSVKAMRSKLIVILLLATPTRCRTTNATRPTAGPEAEFRNTIICVRYLTDCVLLFRYRSHADSTRVYMPQYLQRFHCTKIPF